MIEVTHLLFALALVYVLDLPVVYGMVGGVLPDIDVLFQAGFPFVHRGIVHTPVFVVFAAVVAHLVWNRRAVTASATAGLLSHLFLDTLTYGGVMWLYPLTATAYTMNLFGSTQLAANLFLSAVSVSVIAGWRYRHVLKQWQTHHRL